MNRIRILIMFLISFSMIFSTERYIPKNKEERDYLEKARERTFKVGVVQKNYFASEKIDGVSLNDIVEDMFRSYLGMNVAIEKREWDENYSNFKNGELDILTYLTPSEDRINYALFTQGIIEENLVVVSRDKKIDTINDLNGLEVYVTQNSIYQKFLERLIDKNSLDLKYIEVSDIGDKRPFSYVDSDLNTIGEKNKLILGRLPKATLGLLKEHDELVKIIDNSLDEKYGALIKNWFEKRKEKIFKDKLDKLLTENEKQYLTDLPVLRVAYGDIEKISTYSSLENRYIGIAPRIINYISEKTDIQVIESVNLRKTNWRAWKEKLSDGYIDMMLLSKTSEREKEFLFTNKLSDLNIYEITDLNSENKTNKTIGVIKDSIEEKVALEYFINSKIKRYESEEKINQDFKRKKIDTILSINADNYDISKYTVRVLDVVPMNIVLKKEHIILRDIFNKVIDEFINIDEFMQDSEITRRKTELYEKRAHKNIIVLIVISCFFLSILVMHQTAKMQKHKKTTKELLKDDLTGLYSRRVYNEFCRENIKLEGCAILLDLNNFKSVNDTYGHDYGDKILIEVGKCLQKVFNKDYIFRISGDEFYVFLNCIEDVELKFRKLKKIFKDSTILRNYNISFSLGYYYKKDDVTMIDAFKYADMAMYFAKREKKEWYEEATDEFINQNARKKKLEILIKKGFDKEFYAVFQGKYDLNNKDLIGAEALTRWNNSDLGLVSPIEFIPIAEELGMIHKIDYKIAELAVKETKKMLSQKRVKDDFRMSFNMSVETFRRDDVVEYIFSLLEKYSLDGKNLEIEITESMFLKDAKNVILKLQKLSEKGIYISVDDFTAGYSTVGLLTTLPIDVVKFDRSLMATICENSDKGRSVYIGLAKMIKSLKLKVVAEGIEGKEQYEFLKEIGINYGQGYYLGKPERILKDGNV
ncbi:EAL domain-containing protein [Cetobacterium sp.]|uniref:EAL domain-containing protein n=1 Tax=Cetobacterium sp. TaxID=2071632 RepID=UPI003F3214EA